MDIVSAIVKMLGGLAMFLYGIEVMGDGLKNSSGEALKRVLEKVTGNVIVGVLTGTLVTAVIQSSTATIVLTVALSGIMKQFFRITMTTCVRFTPETMKPTGQSWKDAVSSTLSL